MEKDANPHEFITVGGSIDLGEIDAAVAMHCKIAVGPIRLQRGYPGPKGFGNSHVEDNRSRMDRLRGLGFDSFASFASQVAKNYGRIERAEKGRIRIIERTPGYDLELVLDCKDGKFWTVVTGIPGRPDDNGEVLMRVARAGGSEPAPSLSAQGPRRETLSLSKLKSSGDKGS